MISVYQEPVRPLKHEPMPGILNIFSWKLFTFIRDYFLSNERHLFLLTEKSALIPSGCVTSTDLRWLSLPSSQKPESWAGLFLRCFPLQSARAWDRAWNLLLAPFTCVGTSKYFWIPQNFLSLYRYWLSLGDFPEISELSSPPTVYISYYRAEKHLLKKQTLPVGKVKMRSSE